MKKLIKGLVLGTLLCTLLGTSATAAFSDITDADLALDVEVLQMMGVVEGSGNGKFMPDAPLTRAQFTKMAVLIEGKADEVEGYKYYTIFPDVKSSHWASGYVNLAVRGEEKMIAGYSNGTFAPDENITYGQAVTILMRLLGYADSDVGMVWPTGYLNAAKSIGLTDGISLAGDAQISRGEAAQLFVSLLSTEMKDGSATYGEHVAFGVQSDVILTDASTQTSSGSLAVETSTGVVKLAGSHAPSMLQGQMGTLLLNKRGEAWGFVPLDLGSSESIVVSSAKAGEITDKNGNTYTVTGDIETYYQGEQSTYAETFVNFRSGTRLTLYMGITGKVERIFMASSATEEAVVIAKDGDATRLSTLTGGKTGYSIYRNGEVVTTSSLKAYDVATYLAGENAVVISNFTITGHYDNAYPNASAPTVVTVLGHEFSVLATATASLSSFEVGDQMTLLLTEDGCVAGAVATNKLRSSTVGIASISGNTATVNLVEGIEVTGTVSGDASKYQGELVKVSSSATGKLNLSVISDSSITSTLDVVNRSYGSKDLAADILVFERVGKGPVAEISLEDIRMATVPKGNITYVRYNDNGKVDMLILDNVTGDRYTFGMAKVEKEVTTDPGADGELGTGDDKTSTTTALYLVTETGEHGPYMNGGLSSGTWVGLVLMEGTTILPSYQELEKLKSVSNESWESETSVYVGGVAYAVADDVICYNKTTKSYLSLGAARAFGDSMTLYVDSLDVVRVVEVW